MLIVSEGNSLKCIVTGNRRHSDDLPQGGMEIPCKLIFKGKTVDITKIKKLLTIYPSQVQTSKTSPLKKKQKTCLATPVTQKIIVIDDNFQCSPQTSTSWLTLNRCTLTSSDKEEIMTGKMLTDKHMNFAQEILKKGCDVTIYY